MIYIYIYKPPTSLSFLPFLWYLVVPCDLLEPFLVNWDPMFIVFRILSSDPSARGSFGTAVRLQLPASQWIHTSLAAVFDFPILALLIALSARSKS